LEAIDEIPKALIFVAPYIENENKQNSQIFFHGPIAWDQIRKCKDIYAIFSDDDPFVSLEQKNILRNKVDAITHVEYGQGHFDGDKVPEILEIIKSL